jgi:hypothetical protein
MEQRGVRKRGLLTLPFALEKTQRNDVTSPNSANELGLFVVISGRAMLRAWANFLLLGGLLRL